MRNVAAVILAAGGSSRFGKPKQLLIFRGETLIRRAVRAASEAGCTPVVVVTGEIEENRDAIRLELDIRESRISSEPALQDEGTAGSTSTARSTETSATRVSSRGGPGAILVENATWRSGIGTSIRRGLEALPESVGAVVLLTCDQPFVDAAIVRELIARREQTGKPIVASRYANTLGVPALFDSSCFDALRALPDDSGAKWLIEARRDEVASIVFEEGAIDIDTPKDFERLNQIPG